MGDLEWDGQSRDSRRAEDARTAALSERRGYVQERREGGCSGSFGDPEDDDAETISVRVLPPNSRGMTSEQEARELVLTKDARELSAALTEAFGAQEEADQRHEMARREETSTLNALNEAKKKVDALSRALMMKIGKYDETYGRPR